MSESAPIPPPEPLRVALVITGLEVGGAEKCLTQLALGINRERFAVEVYSLQPRPGGQPAALVEQLEAAHVPVHFLDARSGWSFPRAVWELRRRLVRQRAAIVQAFLYHANVVGVLAARLAAIRCVLTGIRVADPNPYRRQLERRIYPLAALSVCVSQAAAESYAEIGLKRADPLPDSGRDESTERWRQENLRRQKLVVIPNGVDAAAYQSAAAADLSFCGFSDERQVMLFVGRLDRQKGLDWFFHCLPAIFERLPDRELVVVGDGPERNALMRLGVQLDVADNIHFLGRRSDVPALLKRAGLLVLPSRYEGMPNVLLEAMAAGVPVVATEAAGVAEILGESAADCTVRFGRSADLIDRLVAVATDPELRERLIDHGRRRVEQEFSVPLMVRRYEALWTLLTSAGPATAVDRAGSSPPPDTPAPEADWT